MTTETFAWICGAVRRRLWLANLIFVAVGLALLTLSCVDAVQTGMEGAAGMSVEREFVSLKDVPADGKTRVAVKEAIRNGKLVCDWRRGNGKTQALLELVHEDFRGNAVIGCVSDREAALYLSRYREMFGIYVLDSRFVDSSGVAFFVDFLR